MNRSMCGSLNCVAFVSSDLEGAFKETEAVAQGTKCQQPFFSLSLNPPNRRTFRRKSSGRRSTGSKTGSALPASLAQSSFMKRKAGVTRIASGAASMQRPMTAKPLPFFKNRLQELSRDLCLEHGWQAPRGILEQGERNPTNLRRMAAGQAAWPGPALDQQVLQACWNSSDNGKSFENALESARLLSGQGRSARPCRYRSSGAVHSLPRLLDLKTGSGWHALVKERTLPASNRRAPSSPIASARRCRHRAIARCSANNPPGLVRPKRQ